MGVIPICSLDLRLSFPVAFDALRSFAKSPDAVECRRARPIKSATFRARLAALRGAAGSGGGFKARRTWRGSRSCREKSFRGKNTAYRGTQSERHLNMTSD